MRLVLIADGDVFPRDEAVRAKPVTGFVVVHPVEVIVEHPACVLATAGFVHQPTAAIILASPEPAHAAMFPVGVPALRIDVSFGVERRHQFVAVSWRAGGKSLDRARLSRMRLNVWGNAKERVLDVTQMM